MTIAEARGKCKSLVAKVPRDMLIIGILVLASLASFGLGYLAGKDVRLGSAGALEPSAGQAPALEAPTGGVGTGSIGIVASKNGTKYYLSSCAGADRISPANKVWFASVTAAAAAGYTPAANCKGI